MEKSINNKIINLLEAVSFDELTKEQVVLVLSEMTEQEYQSQHLIVKEAKLLSVSQNLKAPASIHAKLQDELAGQLSPPKSAIASILSVGIPLWLAVIIGGGAFGLAHFFGSTKNQVVEMKPIVNQEPVKIEYIYVTDTVYQEIKSEPIVLNKVVKEEVIKYFEVEVPVEIIRDDFYIAGSQKELGLSPIDEIEVEGDIVDEALFAESKEVKGQTVADDRALMELLDNFQE